MGTIKSFALHEERSLKLDVKEMLAIILKLPTSSKERCVMLNLINL